MLRDLVVSIADGGDCLADLAALRGQPELFGEVASSPTAWRVIESITPERLGILREGVGGRASGRGRTGRRRSGSRSTSTPRWSRHSEKEGALATSARWWRSSARAGRAVWAETWLELEGQHAFLKEKVGDGLKLTKIGTLLRQRGVEVPYRTLYRYCAAAFPDQIGGQRETVPVADGEPGHELQADFGRLGKVGLVAGRRRVVKGLVLTACVSRHQFCWPTDGESLAEDFPDLLSARREMRRWCLEEAGTRIHGTTHRRPLEHFLEVEQAHLLPAPTARCDTPVHATPKVARDHHIEVAKALYSVPAGRIGQHVEVRADSRLVKVFQHGQLLREHPRKVHSIPSSPAHRLAVRTPLPPS